MKAHEKIKFIRRSQNWRQEDMAEKLHMHVKSYAKIEQGKVDIPSSRLKKIAEALGVELGQLVDSNEKSVINFIENFYNSINNGIVEQHECKHELEKVHLIIEQKDKIIEQKDKEIAYLKEIIELMKKESAS
ncbi:MAG: helix-turn-helix transcriptional regulator [Thioploca sp.]|nr:helix-turn-helix transcriptional regulator [Thioploca sp.]